MSQNDLVIANQSFPATRADINSALQALGSLNSGSSAPATTYANMLWYDTANNTLKMRAEANDQWISIGYLDQTADAFRIFDDTQVVNSSGTQTGLIGDQATSAWQAGTSTTESLVSPAKVKAAIEQNTPTPTDNFGVNQTWQSVTRAFNTSYQAPADQAIQLFLQVSTSSTSSTTVTFQVSSNNSTWLTFSSATSVNQGGGDYSASIITPTSFVIPAATYYRVTASGSGNLINFWYEMR